MYFDGNKKLLLNGTAILMLFGLVLLLTGCSHSIFGTTEASKSQTVQGDSDKQTELQKQHEADEQKKEEERLREQWKEKDEILKEEMGHFFVPLPPFEKNENPRVKAKGIYVTGNTAGLKERFGNLLELVKSTELNTMVIDVKNDHGLMTYHSEVEIVQEVGADRSVPVKDIQEVINALVENDIYPIARIVVFKDPYLAEQMSDWSIKSKQGGVWRDNKGVAWINPYDQHVWDYNIAIAKEAALMGFREIQFDYVRFPENARRVDQEADFPGSDGVAKDDAIRNFLLYAKEQLEDYNVHIAADTFGVIATSWADADGIGQNWEKVAPVVEYNCPMIYPSHYGPGYFGFAVPDTKPKETVTRALTDAIKRNAPLESPAIIRPWLQSFTATWIKGHIAYGADQVRAQIDAALELGIDEYLIWNASNNYIPAAFLTVDAAKAKEERLANARQENAFDVLGHTRQDALDAFMDAVRMANWREVHVYHATGFKQDYVQCQAWVKKWTAKLVSHKVLSSQLADDAGEFELDLVFKVGDQSLELKEQSFKVYLENDIWRVEPSVEFIETLSLNLVKDVSDE